MLYSTYSSEECMDGSDEELDGFTDSEDEEDERGRPTHRAVDPASGRLSALRDTVCIWLYVRSIDLHPYDDPNGYNTAPKEPISARDYLILAARTRASKPRLSFSRLL